MRSGMIPGLCLVAVLSAGSLWGRTDAQDKNADGVAAAVQEDDADKALRDIAALGQGVHKVKFEDKGRIRSCIIVGQSRISTVLGKAKGLQDARTKSRLACEAEFVRWLKTKVDVHVKNEEETILFLEGNEGNDKDALRESGRSVEKTTTKFESAAQGLVRGLQVLGVVEDAKDKTYTLVMGWSTRTADATRKIQAGLEDGAKGGGARRPGPGVGRGDGGAAAAKKGEDKGLEDHKAVSPDLKKFLD